MPTHLKAALLVTVLLLYAFAWAARGPRVNVQVEGAKYRFAPTDLRLKVIVEPHEDNRLLRVETESGAFGRSSDEDLTGDSPRTRWIEYRDVPAGEYAITATVVTGDGERFTARDTVDVRGFQDE